jgi:hypothetical protein
MQTSEQGAREVFIWLAVLPLLYLFRQVRREKDSRQ